MTRRRKAIEPPQPSHAAPLTDDAVNALKTSLAALSRKDRMLYIIRLDPKAAMRLASESYRATINHGLEKIGDLVSVLEVVGDPGLLDLGMYTKLFDAGLLSFLRDCIASPTFLVMQQADANLLAGVVLQLFNGFLAMILKVDAHHLLTDALDEVHVEPWASLWNSRDVIIRSDLKAELLDFLACSGVVVSSLCERCDNKYMGPGSRLVDILFFAWFHLGDSNKNTPHAVGSLSGIMFDEPVHGLRWPDIIAADGVLASSLVSEYGPHELVRRIESALKSLKRHFKATNSSPDKHEGLYALFLLLAMIPGVCCHVKCRRFLVKYNILPAIEDFTIVYPDHDTCWRASASVTLAIEEQYRKPDGTPGTYEHVLPQTFGSILTEGMFYIYADCMSSLPEEGNREILIELFKRHPCSSAPPRMHYGFWLRTRPTFWYMCLLGLRAAAYREYGKPAYQDIQFLEQCWIDWGEKAKVDEASAQLQHEAERVRFCYSKSCPRGRRLHDRPLLVCRGCGEARFCDKVCQKRGWKEGHRESCRRLPAP